MKCPVCGNEDENYISYINKRPYCRKCIAFGRTYLDEVYPIHKTPLIMTDASYHLSFGLSSRQQFISDQLITNYENATNSIVLAVCGFRVIIVTVANSLGNIRVFELLPKLKTKKYGWCIA